VYKRHIFSLFNALYFTVDLIRRLLTIFMKKTLIISALALSAVSFGFAEETASVTTTNTATVTTGAPATPPADAALPPEVTTGDVKVDGQILALRKEMEGKIRAIREEYQKKLKVIVGERRTTVKAAVQVKKAEVKAEVKAGVQEVRKDARAEVKQEVQQIRQDARPTVKGASTEGPQVNTWGFLRKLFGPKPPAETAAPVTQ
jgi:hypothetical protein